MICRREWLEKVIEINTSRAKSIDVKELDNTKNNPDWEALCKLKGWEK